MAHQPFHSPGPLLRPLLLLVLAAAAVAATSGPFPASAATAPPDPEPPRRYPWGYGYDVGQLGRGGTPSGGSGTNTGSPVSAGGRADPRRDLITCAAGRLGIQACDPIPVPGDPAGGDPPAVSPAVLAQRAWGRLPIPGPQVRTAPPRGSDGLVGLPHWFWVTNWRDHRDRISAGGVWAEVTAQPTSMTITPGGGLPSVGCDGPGTAYDPGRSAAEQRSDCSYTYQRSSAGLPGSAYRVTVTVTWGGTWRGSGGTGGTLPVLIRSTSFDLPVAEGQAVAGG